MKVTKFALGFVCGLVTAIVIAALALIFIEKEVEIPVSLVPETVAHAAGTKLAGFEMHEAEIVGLGDGRIGYEVEGAQGETEYELLITSDGEVLSVEFED